MDRMTRGLGAIAAAAVAVAILLTGGITDAVRAQPPNVCGANPSPPNAADPSVRVSAPAAGARVVGPLRIAGLARVFEASVALELRGPAGETIARGYTMAREGAPALAPFEGTLDFTVATETPACLWVFEESAADGRPRNVVQVPLVLLPVPAPRFVEAALVLDDPRPCIPEAGQRACDAARTALWNGEARAWAARGVTAPDEVFVQTVVLRVNADDPAAIGNIARILGWPYLKVTRVRFGGADFVAVTNLGGGPQDMTGWTLRSPARSLVFRFPDGFVMRPGQEQPVCGLCPPSCPVNPPNASPSPCPGATAFERGFGTTDVFPDDGGRAVLFYDALNLPGDDVLYNADPNNQPPTPNLQGVRVAGDPNARGPVSFILSVPKPAWSTGEPVQFEMLLQNLSALAQRLDVPSGQDFDITVSDETGRAVWRWSEDRAFTEVFRTLTLQPREQRTFSATWDQRDDDGQPVPPGRYQATAVFTSVERIPSNPVSFTIAGAGQSRRVESYAALVEALRAAGVSATDAGPISSPILGGEVRSLRAGGETLQVHEYASEAEATADAARLSPDASTYRRGPTGPIINVDWIAPPHVYRSGRIIVVYVGRDAALLRLLETLLGAQIAGG